MHSVQIKDQAADQTNEQYLLFNLCDLTFTRPSNLQGIFRDQLFSQIYSHCETHVDVLFWKVT